jgi:hypothetical protein
MTTTTQVQLAALGDLPAYRVCAEDTDPRRWDIVDANGLHIGSVHDLIIDLEALTARYMVCSLTHGAARAVLMPVGFARIEKEQQLVHLDFVTAANVDELPAFNGLPASAEVLAQTAKVLTGVTPTTSQKAKVVRRSDETRNAS